MFDGFTCLGNPAVVLLNIWQDFNPDPLKKELVELMLCAACSLIAQRWKTTKVPTLSECFLKVWDFFLQDKVSIAILRADNYPVTTSVSSLQ